MHLDCREYPEDYTFAQQAGALLGLYVKVAGFTFYKGIRIFRMIVDSEIDAKQLSEILKATIGDKDKTYSFAYLETIPGMIVDETPHTRKDASYIRLTFL